MRFISVILAVCLLMGAGFWAWHSQTRPLFAERLETQFLGIGCPSDIQLSPDENTLAITTNLGFYRWSLADMEAPPLEDPSIRARGFVYSPDGQYIAFLMDWGVEIRDADLRSVASLEADIT
jgi:hypothetical protein